jgi:phosphoserine phosphatase
MPTLKMVLFDMDGVIFEGENFWLDLHRRLGTDRAALALAKRYMATDYQRLSRITVERLWRGKPSEPFFELIGRRSLVPGAEVLFAFLRQNRVATAIISSGPYQLAERAQKLLGIDVIRANHVYVEDGAFLGKVDVQVDDANKGAVAASILADFGLDMSSVAGVGDSASDIELMPYAECSIAFNSKSEELNRACRYVVDADLRALIPVLARHFPTLAAASGAG